MVNKLKLNIAFVLKQKKCLVRNSFPKSMRIIVDDEQGTKPQSLCKY